MGKTLKKWHPEGACDRQDPSVFAFDFVELATTRFIAWVAAKRNAATKLEERRRAVLICKAAGFSVLFNKYWNAAHLHVSPGSLRLFEPQDVRVCGGPLGAKSWLGLGNKRQLVTKTTLKPLLSLTHRRPERRFLRALPGLSLGRFAWSDR